MKISKAGVMPTFQSMRSGRTFPIGSRVLLFLCLFGIGKLLHVGIGRKRVASSRMAGRTQAGHCWLFFNQPRQRYVEDFAALRQRHVEDFAALRVTKHRSVFHFSPLSFLAWVETFFSSTLAPPLLARCGP